MPKKHSITSHDPVNVKYYGAKGDGSFDDGAAILEAVHAAYGYEPYNEGYGQSGIYLTRNLYFPAGHYIVTNPILLTHVTASRIFGDGKGATLIENVSTDTTRNKSPWSAANDKYYPNRSVFATDGFSYSQVEQMSLKCNGGICFNHTWARVVPYPPHVVGDTISSQEVQYRDMEFIGGHIGLAMGYDIIPDGGYKSVFTTGSMVAGTWSTGQPLPRITDIPNTNGLFPGMYAEIYRDPFVTGGDGLMVGIRVMSIVDVNTIELQAWDGQQSITITRTNAPIHFTMHGEMTSECISKNCDYINCSHAGIMMGNGNALSMAVIGGYMDTCRTGLLVDTGAAPVVRGTRFHNSTDFDISIDWAAGGDGYSIKGVVTDSVNFARFRSGTNPTVAGCTQHNPTEGVFIQIDTPGTLFVEGSHSQNGKVTGNGTVALRASTFGNTNKLSDFSGTVLEDI